MTFRWIPGFLVALPCAWIGVSAAAPPSTPARMLEGKFSVENQLKVPAGTPEGTYTVFCETVIDTKGRARYPFCYVNDQSSQSMHLANLIAATKRALQYAQFTPATRDGAPADVHMQIMARVQIARKEPLVLVVPNNGVEQGRYGLLYTAPQRFNEFYHELGVPSGKPTTVWLKMHVDEQGKVTKQEVTSAINASPGDVEKIENSVARMEFLPGQVDGKPVEMWYTEPIVSGPFRD